MYSQALKAVGKIFRPVFLEHLYLNTTRKTKPQRDFVLECGDPDPPRSEWKIIAFQALAAAIRAVPGPWANSTPPADAVHEFMLDRAQDDPFLLLVIIFIRLVDAISMIDESGRGEPGDCGDYDLFAIARTVLLPLFAVSPSITHVT